MRVRIPVLRLLLLVPLSFCDAKVYQRLEEVPSDIVSYDFIVAGGGNGGSVVASRLSENPKFSVLLIEAGPDTAGVLNLEVPAYGPRINHTLYNWNFVSEPQLGLNGRTLPVYRGHGLGGSTARNGMVYTRGAADDYDYWARVTGDPGWSWKALWPYIKRNERWVQPAGGRNAPGEYDPRAHGYHGKTQVSLPWNGPTEHDIRTLKKSELDEDAFPLVLDINAGQPIGITRMQSTIGNGERNSAAKSYLPPNVRERPNLTIVLNTYITRVLPVGKTGSKPDLRRLEVAPSRRGGDVRTFDAKKEIVLSGGVIGTPQILMNSGVGNGTELEALGIPSVLDLPAVGRNMTDHVAGFARWKVAPQNDTSIDDETALAMWHENRTGPLTERFKHQILWARIPSNSSIFEEFADPAPGPTTPHIESPLDAAQMAAIGLMTPHSRGSVRLKSNNPFEDPAIDLGLFTHPFDMAAIKEGVRIMKRFYSGPAWEGYITGFEGPDPDVLTDEEFETTIKASAITFYHPVGTAAMSSRNSREGVVDPELRVKGAKGLRIVDSSVFPYILAAHTQAAVYILAERASDLIRDSW